MQQNSDQSDSQDSTVPGASQSTGQDSAQDNAVPEAGQSGNEHVPQPGTEAEALEALKQAAKEKFSDAEIKEFINMGCIIASKAVLTHVAYLMDMRVKSMGDKLNERGKHRIEMLKRNILSRAKKNSGYISLTFSEIPYQLCVSLAVVPREYRTNIDIPSDKYARDLIAKYHFLKQTAAAYWQEFRSDKANKSVVNDMDAFLGDIDMSQLQIDPNNPTTMYFSPQSLQRVGIFCYYLDEAGKPLYKRQPNPQ